MKKWNFVLWLVGATKDATLPETLSLSEINSRPVIVDSAVYPGFRRLLEQRLNQHRILIKPTFESDNAGTLKRVIESGVGWGFMPAHSIRKQVRTRRLTRVHVDEVKYAVNINLYSLKAPGIKPMSETIFRAIQQQTFA